MIHICSKKLPTFSIIYYFKLISVQKTRTYMHAHSGWWYQTNSMCKHFPNRGWKKWHTNKRLQIKWKYRDLLFFRLELQKRCYTFFCWMALIWNWFRHFLHLDFLFLTRIDHLIDHYFLPSMVWIAKQIFNCFLRQNRVCFFP